jgi:4-hydroxybenzoate polyprenyltransferase
MNMEKNGFFRSSILLLKSRKEVIFGISWCATFATIVAGKGIPPLTTSFLSIIGFLMLSLSVYIYNDITDREMDAFSKEEKKKGRPIAHGIVSVKNAKQFVLITGLLGLGIFFIMSRIGFTIGFIYYVLLILYSYPAVHFKRMYIIKNIVTAFSMPTAFLISGATIENTISMTTFFVAFAYYCFNFLVIPALADSLDVEEDLAFNVKTIGNTLSWRQNVILYNLGMLFILSSTLVTYFFFNFHYVAPIMMTGFCILAIVHSLRLINEDISSAAIKLRPFGYSVVILSPIIFALGAAF